MHKRVLVTGGSGFVGRVLLQQLRASCPDASITAISRGSRVEVAGVEWLECDLLGAELADIVREVRPTHVAHLAARSSVVDAERSSVETVEANVVGSMRLADNIAVHAPSARLLFSSSGEVYGKAYAAGDLALSEDSPVLPVSVYARSKLAAEFVLMDRIPAKASLVIMRPLNHIGPGQDERFVVASFARQVAEIEAELISPKILVGNLDAQRDFTDVTDVARAYVHALFDTTDEARIQIYNLSSGRLRTVRSVLEDLISLSNVRCVVESDPARLRPIDVPYTALSSARFRNRFKWQPQQAWADTIASVLEDARRRFGRS